MEKRNDGFVNFCVEWTCGFVNLQIRVDQKFCATLLCSVVDALDRSNGKECSCLVTFCCVAVCQVVRDRLCLDEVLFLHDSLFRNVVWKCGLFLVFVRIYLYVAG